MKLANLVIAAVVMMPLANYAAAASDCAHNWMLCSADSSLQINSFTIQAASVISSIAAFRATALSQLKAHKITVTQAKQAQAQADQGHMLWQQAVDACDANASGNCLGDGAGAVALLIQAQKAIQ